MVRCPLKTAFFTQRKHARNRGIEFNLSFEQWIDWWGEDIERRGRGSSKLQMCRNGDCGPYELGNIYKATHSQNIKLRNSNHHKPHALSEDQKEEVRSYLNNGLSTRKVAALFNTSQKTIMRTKHEEAA